ncbi:Eco57I restriction-modification methylase domain-containing protein [Nonlabens ponticola]|uniref:site-specific DNA-methyltransferase (adenine-specific) n=1 Tax=Nonlabens ponticola TaxID=2496866 RepID=A0A3S9MZY5_9FLAO|nr:TaqI-like C-terminal specificity domain-containing protein [Nonlabens ponticola]AZQ44846.1 restriction endonuclease subunit M [Nonlabens ponticola]
MALFQTSVLKKYLAQQDTNAVDKAYRKYTKFFLNLEIQQNIDKSNEEQIQATFLTELFVNVLDYTINPKPKYNLTTEYKNEKNNRKADGAIITEEKTVAVVELKGTNTKDLESIRRQAFDYKVNHKGCRFVITSNFEKLRFYIDDTTELLDFDLFNLTRDDFGLLYLCLYKDNLLKELPLQIKQDSLIKEEEITKEFYKDYSLFKRELYRDLVKKNGKVLKVALQEETGITDNAEHQSDLERLEKNVKLTLFKKSQKLIDRFLFIFFAEDRGLLQPNYTIKRLAEWDTIRKLDVDEPLYDRFKKHFNYLDKGRKGDAENKEIFAYNGGLFKPDSILDRVIIDDDLLYNHTKKLATYDFESQVDVNILGHIFENSLNEIESINAEIEGGNFDKQKSKRKKDGVFYTPKYITKYIVENTVGKLCDDRKTELGFKEEEYFKGRGTGRKKRNDKTIQKLVETLDTYRDWLLQITICDPACGSGAFLNQALDFLIKEHQYIDELKTKILGGGLQFPDIENTILENNIYGVDLNEESVEIAKLSLWLRTAQPRRKLNDLSSNIKCGNSLIDSKTIAGDKAFNWETAFAKVFANGGFDVVIGNPPYGIFLSDGEEAYYKKNYPLTSYKINLYILFIERMFQIFEKGLIQFIIPKSLLFNTYFKDIREYLLTKSKIHEVFMISEKIFPDAEVGGSLILKYEIVDNPNISNEMKLISADKYFDYDGQTALVNDISQEFFLSVPHFEISPIAEGANLIVKKLHTLKTIREFYTLKNGLNPGNIKQILITDEKLSDNHKPIIWGKELNTNSIQWGGQFVNYDYNIADNLNLDDIQSKKGMKKQTRIDFALRTPELFENEKIVVRKTGDRFIAAKDNNNYYFDTLVHGIYENNEEYSLDFLLTILNSQVATIFYRLLHDIKGKVFAKISLDKLGAFPLPGTDFTQRNDISQYGLKLQKLQPELNSLKVKFVKYLFVKFQLLKTSRKLENWQDLDFGEFIKELNKAIKATNKLRDKEGQAPVAVLTKTDEFEWLDLFEQNKKKAQDLQSQINTLEQQIDAMVYQLYGLSDEEIRIVENG